MVGQHPTDELAPQLVRIGTGIVGHAGEHDEATIWSHQNPPAADIMPMQIGAVRNATKPSSSAKAFSIENLPLRGMRRSAATWSTEKYVAQFIEGYMYFLNLNSCFGTQVVQFIES